MHELVFQRLSKLHESETYAVACVKPVFHFARIVAKGTGEHAQIEKSFLNLRTSGNTAEKRLRMRQHY
jgi:hypothetical protein